MTSAGRKDPSADEKFDLLSEIERVHDVWNWEFQGLRYWPLLRSLMRVELLRPFSVAVGVGGPERKAEIKQAPPRMPSTEVSALWNARFSAVERWVDALFLSRAEDNCDVVAGVAHDRMIDPIYRRLETQGYRPVKLRVDRGRAARSEGLAIESAAFNPDDDADIDLTVPALPELDRLIEWIGSRGVAAGLKSATIRSAIRRTFHRELVFGALLDRCRPGIVLLGVFDDPVQMAAVLACRRRGIPVVDLQHGKQGRDHLLCTKWENIGPGGSDLLPDRFWVWGEPTARRVAAALGVAAEVHRPVVGGNAWLAEWRAGMHGGEGDVRPIVERHAGASRRILVCLQPIADPVPSTLREAMAASPAGWVWWVRLHRKQREQRDSIAAILSATGARFEIDEPSALPLYPLLMASDCHLTGWSTVAFEAEAFGIPTVLFHPIGQTIFADEIAEGRFLFAETGADLLSLVAAAGSSIAGSAQEPYVVSDLGHADRTAEALLSLRRWPVWVRLLKAGRRRIRLGRRRRSGGPTV